MTQGPGWTCSTQAFCTLNEMAACICGKREKDGVYGEREKEHARTVRDNVGAGKE